MQDKLTELKELLEAYKTEEKKFTGFEIVLLIIDIFLFGMLIGMIISPRKTISVGCNNGNDRDNVTPEYPLFDDDIFENEDIIDSED